MGLFIAIMIGLAAAIAMPASVADAPETFGGLLNGALVHIPFTYQSIHLSIPVWIGVTALIWGLFKVARG